ncbi:MAG: OmpA family protein [Treponema sp.]|jgi:outer membrane protein OmpA-like peptidoglycan-associated protein|nr:OmpA family protein [Treponema sp.]
MKKINIISFAVLIISGLPLAPVHGQEGFSFGAGAEGNLLTLEDQSAALGGVINMENRLGPVFAMGVNIGSGYGWNNFFSIESRVFGRWYFAQPGNVAFFFQADAGLLVTFRSFDFFESRGSPSAGLTLGSRIKLSNKWFIEPYIRGGYPYLGGIGVLAGYSLHGSGKTKIAPNDTELKTGEELVVFRYLDTVPEIAALSIDPYIYFGSNIARFTGLDRKTVENNYRLLRELAVFLNQNQEYSLIIEGHANPVTLTKDEESMSLNPLSIERAELIANTLIQNGVDRKRLIIAGSGGTKTLVPWSDREHWSLNRRVEFVLIRQRGGNL